MDPRLTRAHQVARALKAGTVNINTTDGGDITAPFGGYKQSGIGRDNPFTRSRSISRSSTPTFSSSASPAVRPPRSAGVPERLLDQDFGGDVPGAELIDTFAP